MATARRRSIVDVLAPEDLGPSSTTSAAAAAGTSTEQRILAQIPIDQIHVHPKNPRHDATAEEDMVASVKEAGILVPGIVGPHPEGSDPKNAEPRYMLIDGHTRLDAALRAGLTTYPAVIRRDLKTEADQIKAMIITGTQRRQLTPIEEAEGYQLLLDLKIKVNDIARDMGVSATTVRERVKLLKLAPKVKNQTHQGQITIDDALAIAALPQTEQSKVAKAAGTNNFRYELEDAKRRAARREVHEKKLAELVAAGIEERKLGVGKTIWNISDANDGMTRLGATFSSNEEDHRGCLAYVVVTGPELEYVCTNLAAHDEQLDEKQRESREEQERYERERQARSEAAALARRLRCDTLLEAVKPGIKVDPLLTSVLRVFLPTHLSAMEYRIRAFFNVLDVPEEERWADYRSWWKAKDREAWDLMMRRIETANAATLIRILIAVLIADTENNHLGLELKNKPDANEIRSTIAGYYELLESIGFHPTDVDADYRAIANPADESEAVA